MSYVSRYRRIAGQQDQRFATDLHAPGGKFVAGAKVDSIALANRIKPRSAGLMGAIGKVDATVDTAAREAIMTWVRDEYDARQGGMLIGLFAKCYLGPPYVDHKLSLVHTILEHYAPADDPGHPYNLARGLVRSGAYAYVEIYSDGAIVPVRPDGTSVEFTPAPAS